MNKDCVYARATKHELDRPREGKISINRSRVKDLKEVGGQVYLDEENRKERRLYQHLRF